MNHKILFLFALIVTLTMNVSFAQVDSALPDTTIENITSKTILVNIEGMACQEGCADKISSNLMETEGVVSSEISFENKNGLITFDPSIITLEEVQSVITDTKVKEYTYTIKSITSIDQ